jgi:hypothetical protein
VDLLAITAKLYVVNGAVQDLDLVPGLIAQPAPPKPARGRERDFLFAHLTLTGPSEAAAELSSNLVEFLAVEFYRSPGSVTSSLRRAVIATNERLLHHNLSRSPTSQTAIHEGALTCATLHTDELYTLQVGEGLAFLGHNFGVERLPVQLPQHLTPLGRSAGFDIRFAYHRLQNGDMMLLADPRLAYLTGSTLAPVLVDTEIESGLESLVGLVAGDTARLLLVEFADELPSTLPLKFVHNKQSATARRPAAAAALVTKKSTGPISGQAPASIAPSSPDVLVKIDESISSPLVTTGADTVGTSPVNSPSMETGARRVASTSARSLSKAIGWLSIALGRLRSSDGGDGVAETDRPPVHWAVPTMIALLVPILLAVVVTGVYFRRDNIEQMGTIKQQMMDALAMAEENSGDPSVARAQYGTVLSLAFESESLWSGDPDVLRMRNQANNALDRLDGVTRLSAQAFYRYRDETTLNRIIQAGDGSGLVVLDKTAGRVYLHPIDRNLESQTVEEPVTLAFTGQAVGSRVIGPLIDVMWLPGGAAASAARDSVAILDRAGTLFNYFPNLGDIRGLSLDNNRAWLAPVVMGTFINRLYLLDNGARQIWKYFPQDAGFYQDEEDPVIAFTDDMELDKAIDFDIYTDDGGVIILYGDGGLRYYDSRSGRTQWDENTVLASNPGASLVAPKAIDITGRGLTASIFVLDPGLNRLLELSRGGQVLAQYRILDAAGNDLLSQANDLVVVSSPFRVFFVAGNTIYVATRE